MPKVEVKHKSTVGPQDAMGKIKTFFETDQDLRRLDPKIECNFPNGSTSGKVKGSQFKADIVVTQDGTGSAISVVIDLPLLLAPFKGKVEESIKKKLGRYLA
ncbi:MAG: hypothetical protein BroJett040_14460 [Oligoflexia bacterium]|nr:MAG: hypothetical protein BroJett040_14460 [Oligoflexia bacterium]